MHPKQGQYRDRRISEESYSRVELGFVVKTQGKETDVEGKDEDFDEEQEEGEEDEETVVETADAVV